MSRGKDGQLMPSKPWKQGLLLVAVLALVAFMLSLQMSLSEDVITALRQHSLRRLSQIDSMDNEVHALSHEKKVLSERLESFQITSRRQLHKWSERTRVAPLRLPHKSGAVSPLSVLVSGHKQGTMWFVEILKDLMRSTQKVKMCSPRSRNGYRRGVGGMWRWATGPRAFGGDFGFCGLLDPIGGYPEDKAELAEAAAADENLDALQLVAAFDLSGKDLDLLAQDCIPGYKPAFPKRTSQLKPCATSFAPFSMVRLVRDPRDVIISGYYHHKGCHREGYIEQWTIEPSDKFGGMSYCDKLNSVGLVHGLLLEMQMAGKAGWLNNLLTTVQLIKRRPELTNYVHFVTYEHLWTDLNATMTDLARHLFPTSAEIADHFREVGIKQTLSKWATMKSHTGEFKKDASNGVGWQNTHMRSGKPSQWKAEFDQQLVTYFLEYGLEEIVEFFGLESSTSGLETAGDSAEF